MELYNKTKDVVIAKNVIIADSFLKRLFGLMGRSNLPADTAMVIKPCKQVHTLFMRFTITAVFLDAEGNVLHISYLKPWQISKFVKDSVMVVELRYCEHNKVTNGDMINLIDDLNTQLFVID